MIPSLGEVAAAQAGVFTRAQALECGYTADEIRARLRAGTWWRVRHGVYAGSAPADPHERHVRQCWAAILAAGPSSVVTGPSACVVHGVDVVSIPRDVHLGSPHPRSARGMDVRRMELGGDDVVEVAGLRVTSLARTAVETARRLDFAPGVAAVDSALRAGELDPEVLLSMLGDGRDVARARRVLRFADARSESVGESLARVALDAAGLPRPVLQPWFVVASGRRYRVDFYWPAHRTIGEFDGKQKYIDGRPMTLWEEKRREDELRALGNAFVRFGSPELDEPGRLRAMFEKGFVLGDRFVA